MKKGFELVKTIGYVLVIILIFSPLTFLISKSITGTVDNDCFLLRPDIENGEFEACQEEFQQEQKQIEQQEFLIVSIISIVTIVILLVFSERVDSIISYSLFFASALNTIIVVIGNSSSSLLAAFLGVVLFILVLIFINKNLKK